ncbi:MAG: DUF3313 domain-containing protein [Planctomycetota bacterium]|jgi:hypothetical protein
MKLRIIVLALVAITLATAGCGGKHREPTGFLSDYSKLVEESGSTLRYMNEAALDRYSGFIVDPIQTRIDDPDGALTDEDIADLTSYMYDKVVEAIQKSGDRIAYRPAADVARLRIAFTDIGKSHPISILPYSSIAGFGIGGASAEAELVDSITGEQIGAVVQSKEGQSKVPFTTLGDWTAAKQTIDTWAKNLEKRLSAE